jgi:hypothetical protein
VRPPPLSRRTEPIDACHGLPRRYAWARGFRPDSAGRSPHLVVDRFAVAARLLEIDGLSISCDPLSTVGSPKCGAHIRILCNRKSFAKGSQMNSCSYVQLSMIATVTSTLAVGCVGDGRDADEPSGMSEQAVDTTQSSCIVLVSKVKPGESMSAVVAQECIGPGEAHSGLFNNKTLLFRGWDLNDFGNVSVDFSGNDGPCDESGYTIDWVGSGWNDSINSFRTFNRCDTVLAFKDINLGGQGKQWTKDPKSKEKDFSVRDTTPLHGAISSFQIWQTNP